VGSHDVACVIRKERTGLDLDLVALTPSNTSGFTPESSPSVTILRFSGALFPYSTPLDINP
jgi:hypothetical protein